MLGTLTRIAMVPLGMVLGDSGKALSDVFFISDVICGQQQPCVVGGIVSMFSL